jgi:hypothetical protein
MADRPTRPPNRPAAGSAQRPGGAAPGRGAGGAAPPLARRPGQPVAPGAARAQAAGPDAEGPSSELQPQLDELEAKIEKLRIDFQRYFGGDPRQPQPPEDLMRKVEGRLRQLRSYNIRRSVDHFRLGTLEARFNSYREMNQRRLRAVEEGRVPPRRQAPAAAPPRFDVERGVLVGPSAEPAAVEALFQGLCERSPRGAPMDLDAFRSYLARQVAQIQEKTGCSSVQFRVLTEEGKVKIKARPVGAAGA